MAPQTKDQQVRNVVVGVAVGVLAHGVSAVTSSKPVLESAFNRAWWAWPEAEEFRSIRGHNPGNLFWIGMGKSECRQGACAAWTEEAWASPYIRIAGWTVGDALDHISTPTVSADDWVHFGEMFLARFKAHEIRGHLDGPGLASF